MRSKAEEARVKRYVYGRHEVAGNADILRSFASGGMIFRKLSDRRLPTYPMYPLPFSRFYFLLLVFFGFLIISCSQEKHGPVRKVVNASGGKDLFTVEAFHDKLAGAMPKIDTGSGAALKNLDNGVRFVYQSSAYQPLWVTEAGVTEAAESLLKDLDSLRFDGISPERYELNKLNAAFNALKKGGDLDKAMAFDTACTRAWLMASRDLLLGIVVPRKADSLWYHSNDSLWDAPRHLAKVLGEQGLYPALSAYRSHIPTYALLRREYARYTALSRDAGFTDLKASIGGNTISDDKALAIVSRELPWVSTIATDSLSAAAQAVRSYQEHYGLPPTGKADSVTVRKLHTMPDAVLQMLAVNMERLRWMPESLEEKYVLVDIPLMELFFRKDGSDAFHMRVVVGKPSRQTPVLNANMANVVFSPSWGVPPTILKKDVLPGLNRRGSAYLAKKGLKAYDRHGHKVNASSINGRNYRNYTFKQPPGARNALGEVKFNLPNRWDIYLHDTPHRDDFARRYRAKSSGCVRVQHPREFAEFILKDLEGRNFDQGIIDSIISTRKTRFEQLKSKIPVHIIYLTAFEDSTGNHLRMIPDIYQRDAKLMRVMAL